MQPTSTENQFTPPPWTYDFSPNEGHESEFMVLGPRSAEIAYVGTDEARNVVGPTVEANARLIAAAPELLEALKDMTTHLRSFTLDPGEGEDDAPALTAAEALIAKAEGRTS